MGLLKDTPTQHSTWCIYGAGRAGQARLRSLPSELGVKGTLFSARSNELEALLKTQRFDGVVICTENQRHAKDIRCALSHGCHVIVEFPLALNANDASKLVDLAKSKALLLHCEHIGLLKPSIQWLLQTKPALSRINVDFQGGLYRWLADSYHSEAVAHLIVGRLQVLWALCGPLTLKDLRYLDQGDGFSLEAQFKSPSIETVTLKESRRPQLKRQSNWEFLSEEGTPLTFPSFEPSWLFYEDWCAALAELSGEAPYLKESDVIAVLALCDQIQAAL